MEWSGVGLNSILGSVLIPFVIVYVGAENGAKLDNKLN